MSAWLHVLGFLLAVRQAEGPMHKVDVRIAGPLAMVEVWRSLEGGSLDKDGVLREALLDLSLPEGAVLVDWELVEAGKRTSLQKMHQKEAVAAFGTALALRHAVASLPAADGGADYRIHIVQLSAGPRAVLHYRYSVPPACTEGRFSVRIPSPPEDSPISPDVTATFETLPDEYRLGDVSLAGVVSALPPGARRLVLRGRPPAQAAWEIAWRFQQAKGTSPVRVLAARARLPRDTETRKPSRAKPREAVLSMICREGAPIAPALASAEVSRVFVLLDRSRSLGAGGVSAERAFARALLEALPPAVAFNAIFFGEEAKPLFVLPRMATREALHAFTEAADPNQLESGTAIEAALTLAGRLLGHSAPSTETGTQGRTWLVLITDGAFPGKLDLAGIGRSLLGSGLDAKLLVLFVRQPGDEEVPWQAVQAFSGLVRSFGGMVRIVPKGSPADAARSVLADMARGGDLIQPTMESLPMVPTLPPGSSAMLSFVRAANSARSVRVRARALAGEITAQGTCVPVPPEWLQPLLAKDEGRNVAWSGASAGMVVAVLPVALPPAQDEVIRGQMDPVVLRNTLSLAFMPRARACYLARRVATANDVYLRGRLRLELTMERGELHEAKILNSTLHSTMIENCVRDAAYAVEYPRPEHRDAPTSAILNLVFRPHTAEEERPDASAVDREIDVILGPLSFPTDPKDLLSDPAPEKSLGQ